MLLDWISPIIYQNNKIKDFHWVLEFPKIRCLWAPKQVGKLTYVYLYHFLVYVISYDSEIYDLSVRNYNFHSKDLLSALKVYFTIIE